MSDTARKTATFIKDLDGWRGHASLYRMEPPHEGHEFVIASAVDLIIDGYVMPGPSCETYLFGANADGEVEDYMELDGSLKSVKDHDAALIDAGYEVVR